MRLALWVTRFLIQNIHRAVVGDVAGRNCSGASGTTEKSAPSTYDIRVPPPSEKHSGFKYSVDVCIWIPRQGSHEENGAPVL
jgi:hypothetical protein